MNDVAAGIPIEPLSSACFPSHIPIGEVASSPGYLNKQSGWADAEGGIQALLEKVASLGGKIRPGVETHAILYGSSGEAKGVGAKGGEIISADVIVLATGSWTPSTFPEEFAELRERIIATGQSVASVQLTSEEADSYKVNDSSDLLALRSLTSYLPCRTFP